MKTILLLLFSLLHCTLLHAQPNQKPKPNDFIFELTHINQPDADIYVISQDNVKKFSEWQNPPDTYWGPSKNGVDGSLTYKFPLNQPTEKIHLVANLASFNFAFGRGSGTGQSSLWASKDGKNWKPLYVLENEVGAEFSYPYLIQTKDQKVHITYTWKRKKMKHVVLTIR
jgi:predicted neuraminidase